MKVGAAVGAVMCFSLQATEGCSQAWSTLALIDTAED